MIPERTQKGADMMRTRGKHSGETARNESTTELEGARAELAHTLRTVLKDGGENELTRLLLDLCEREQLRPCEHEGIRCWEPTDPCELASRAFALENEIRAATASLFFDRMLLFSVEAGTPLAVRWMIAPPFAMPPN